jgi:tRNA nucleotidyltransferase (CCA-adding enzyme)
VELVFSHHNMDFDSLAAQYAVCKLFPSAKMVLGYPLVGSLRRFVALHRDRLPIVQAKYIDYSRVTRMFVVDCQRAERIDENAQKLLEGVFGAKCPCTVFDHHERDPEGLAAVGTDDSSIENVGSCTTILVDKLRRANTQLSPFEATLFAIGIYEDTGNLTYSGTTEKDAVCVAYLLGQGADLAIVGDFIRPKLDEELTELLETLIDNCKRLQIGGMKILLSSASLSDYLDGLATLTRKLCEIESADAAITVVKMKNRIHIVCRSDTRTLDIRPIVREFGGDGHPGAASAVSKEADLNCVLERVEALLYQLTAAEITARSIMTTPVRTIKPRTTMQDANRLMLRYGQDGLLVAEGEMLIGVISRRDIDRATHHKLGHAPVLGFMSRPVISITPGTTIGDIQALMVKEDIGRLPVVGVDHRLLGVVTRADVLKSLYGSEQSSQNILAMTDKSKLPSETICLSAKLQQLDEETQAICRIIGETAATMGMTAYIVGGFVRDLLLSRANLDLDFVIEGSAIEVAQALVQTGGGEFELLIEHERFKTAQLRFHGKQLRKVDLASARSEFYEYPAALPTVEMSQMEPDLLRRDFTINAMAICLNPDRYGNLTDLFGGQQDLSNKLLRVMHSFSFIEDPTRLIRAARFAARLSFTIEEKTMEQARRAVALDIFDDLGGVRMRDELKLILESQHRLDGLDLLAQTGANMRYLDTELKYKPSIRKQIRIAGRLLQRYPVEQPWIVYLGVLLAEMEIERVPAVLERLHLTNEQKQIIQSALEMPGRMRDLFVPVQWSQYVLPKRSQIYKMFTGRSDESLAIAASLAVAGSPVRRLIKLYRGELENEALLISGNELLQMGVPQGPALGKMLELMLEAKLDNLLKTREDELAFANKLHETERL